MVEKVLRLTRRKEKYLVVAAVRFLRTCISLKVCSGLLFFSSYQNDFLVLFEMTFDFWRVYYEVVRAYES